MDKTLETLDKAATAEDVIEQISTDIVLEIEPVPPSPTHASRRSSPTKRHATRAKRKLRLVKIRQGDWEGYIAVPSISATFNNLKPRV